MSRTTPDQASEHSTVRGKPHAGRLATGSRHDHECMRACRQSVHSEFIKYISRVHLVDLPWLYRPQNSNGLEAPLQPVIRGWHKSAARRRCTRSEMRSHVEAIPSGALDRAG